MADGEITIGVGIRTELSTDARELYDSPAPCSVVTQITCCAIDPLPLQ
jgi:hypothetical protein